MLKSHHCANVCATRDRLAHVPISQFPNFPISQVPRDPTACRDLITTAMSAPHVTGLSCFNFPVSQPPNFLKPSLYFCNVGNINDLAAFHSREKQGTLGNRIRQGTID